MKIERTFYDYAVFAMLSLAVVCMCSIRDTLQNMSIASHGTNTIQINLVQPNAATRLAEPSITITLTPQEEEWIRDSLAKYPYPLGFSPSR